MLPITIFMTGLIASLVTYFYLLVVSLLQSIVVKYGVTKDMKKNSEMTEDEQKASEKAIQDLTDKYSKILDGVAEAKNKEIMSI